MCALKNREVEIRNPPVCNTFNKDENSVTIRNDDLNLIRFTQCKQKCQVLFLMQQSILKEPPRQTSRPRGAADRTVDQVNKFKSLREREQTTAGDMNKSVELHCKSQCLDKLNLNHHIFFC